MKYTGNLSAKDIINEAEKDCAPVFAKLSELELKNQRRVLDAFKHHSVSTRHFTPSYGYGYDDAGRDVFEKVLAEVLFCEDAIARPQIASGTHALYLCLDALLSMNDKIVFASGAPYDTLRTALDHKNSFKRNGVTYSTVALTSDGKIDVDAVINELDASVRIVYVQRSRGYEWRDALTPSSMEALFKAVHEKYPNIITVVDNCYGEFTNDTEPSCFGADVLVGSFIKNIGGAFAPTGGYITGKADVIEMVADRLTVPGTGREIGSYAAGYMPFYQGLFMAPHTTVQALKTVVLFARVFEKLGLLSCPSYDAPRSDIVQALRFKDRESLIDFCTTIQSCAPVDSFVVPVPWAMPGYQDEVIMAAGTFIQGSSIELTADAPIREPYTAYMQGSMTYAHGRIAPQMVVEKLIK